MTLSKIKKMKDERGFTIVELLIVIVVIAILAAIVIVAYNGVQNRAKSSAGQATANSLVKKFEALNSIKGAYYTTPAAGVTAAQINTYASAAPAVGEANIDNTASVVAATSATASGLTATTANNGNTVAVWACPAGANIWYWDFAAATPAAVQVKAGAGC
ncbi:type II secretion system protein [Streptomyces caniscabiei]|uniref:type II secretion system protein n=1 Tax=Streptomyces caniscabiei TaxID=2746961 RepID=UPI0029A0EE19|nr:type II secretion system protein [Streptomyces caniscabiei]MDX2776629.1 type II secretion system protein [Streptomyces caniscabiei]